MVILTHYLPQSNNISLMKMHLLENGILDYQNESMYRIAPEAVDPAILSRGALSYQRYTRSALLLLREDALSHDRPDCFEDKRLKSLGLWKLDQSNYLNQNSGNGGSGGTSDNNSAAIGGINNERRHIGKSKMLLGERNGGGGGGSSGSGGGGIISSSASSSTDNQLLQQKNYVDPRSISSSHLMPKFIKRRNVGEQQQQQSSSSTNIAGSSTSDYNDTKEQRYNRKDHFDDNIDCSIVSPRHSNTGNRIVLSPSNSDHHHHQQQQQHHHQNSITTNLRGNGGGERRIGSGRISFARDWDYRNNDKDNNLTDINNERNDYNNSYHRGSGNNNSNNYNTRYDNRNMSSQQQQQQQQQSDYRNDRRSYGRNNDYDNHRGDNTMQQQQQQQQQQQYHQTKKLISDHINQNSSINNHDQQQQHQHHHNNHSTTSKLQHQKYNTRHHRNDNYSSRNDEPEWFSGGPTSQHDTIELRGFDENDDLINIGQNNNNNNRNRKNSSTSSTDSFQQFNQYFNLNKNNENRKHNNNSKSLNNDSTIKINQQLNNDNKITDDVEPVSNNNNITSPPPARSTPTKKLLNNKNKDDGNVIDNNDENINKNNDDDDGDNNDDKKSTINDEKIQNEFNIDAFLNVDPLNNCFGGEQKTDNIVSGSSRFRRWFKNENDDKNIIDNSRRSSLHEELNNIINDEKDSKKLFSPISPTKTGNDGGPQQHNSQQSLLEFLQRGNFISSNKNEQQISPNLPGVNIQPSKLFQQQQLQQQQQQHQQQQQQNLNSGRPGGNQIYSNSDNKQKGLIPSVEELEARMRKNNNESAGNIQNPIQSPLNIATFNQMLTNTAATIDCNMQNNQPKQDMEAFKRLLEQITPNNNLFDCSTGNLLNDTIQQQQQQQQQQNLFQSRQDDFKKLIFQQQKQMQQQQQQNNFARQQQHQQQQQQIIRSNEMLQKSAQAILANENLNDIFKRPEAQILLQGVARGELTQSSLIQLANSNGGSGGRYSEVILPILNLLRIPTPLNFMGNNHHGQQQQQQQQQQILSPNSNLELGQQQNQATGMPRNIPSPRELQVHTQSIMQTALIRKKLEEQQENYRRRQEIQQKHPQQQNHLLNQIVNPIDCGMGDFIGNLRNSPTQMRNIGGKAIIGSQNQISSPIPTSVLRKMTAEKDNGINMQFPQQQNNITSNQIAASSSGQPRMILGGGGGGVSGGGGGGVGNQQQQQQQQQQQYLQQNTAPISPQSLALHHRQQNKWNPTNNQIGGNKPMGRPILKGGPSGVPATMVPPQIPFASKIEFQQLQQQQRNKMIFPQQHQQLPSAQQTSGNVLLNQIEQQQHLQQIFQQQQQQQQFQGNDKTNTQQQLNIQREGGLSPTYNQLARWFSPELLAQASAGKLPALNMNQALSLEEFEKSIQHSFAAVHN